MRDLTFVTGALAGGQRPAAPPADGPSSAEPTPARPSSTAVDPHAVARRVYRLMRSELIVRRDRRAGRS
jgi:hypothetical protein